MASCLVPAAGGEDGVGPTSLRARCVYCESEVTALTLNCAQHKMCQDCLPKNIERFGYKGKEMYTCPKCTKPAVQSSHVWIFADNSNIWIQAMKHAGKAKGFGSKQDHRVRIDIGRLTDVVAGDREVKAATLYGSEPPQVDSVWKKINQYEHWTVKTKKRSAVTGKEKEVDAELVTDVTEVACNTPPHMRGTIIIISGDRDMCPAVQKTLKNNGGESAWKVEIHVWKHAHTLLSRLEEFGKEYPGRVFCDLLDNHMDKVTFLNRIFLPKKTSNVDHCSAVISIKQGQDISKEIIKNDNWWNILESAARWPVEYVQPEKNEERHLVLVFRDMEQGGVNSLVAKFNNPSTQQFSLPHVEGCELYSNFKRRTQRGQGRFVTSEDGWTTVVKRNIPKPTSSNTRGVKSSTAAPTLQAETKSSKPTTQTTSCCSGKNCDSGLKCKFGHTDEERKYFGSRRDGVGNEYRKTGQCKDYPRCKNSTNRCNYAHEKDDRWCLKCHETGHFSKDCKNSNCSHPRHSQSS